MPRQLNKLTTITIIILIASLIILFNSSNVLADNSGILEGMSKTYKDQLGFWADTIKGHASRLFWSLAVISCVFQFGFAMYEGMDVHKLFGTLLRFVIVTGLMYTLIYYGAEWMEAVIDSFELLGVTVSSSTTEGKVGASGIMDLGIKTFINVLKAGAVTSSLGFMCIFTALITIVIFAIVAANITVEYIVTWCVLFIGLVVLGFGGLFITREWAVTYVKACIAQGIKLLTIFVLVGTTYVILNEYLTSVKDFRDGGVIAVVLIHDVIMLLIIQRAPGVVAGLVGAPLSPNMGVFASVAAGGGMVLGLDRMAGKAIGLGGNNAGGASGAVGQFLRKAFTETAKVAATGGAGAIKGAAVTAAKGVTKGAASGAAKGASGGSSSPMSGLLSNAGGSSGKKNNRKE